MDEPGYRIGLWMDPHTPTDDYPGPVKTRPAAFFDLDKTIIAKSSAFAFGAPFRRGGLVTRRAMLKMAYAQLMFMLTGADDDTLDHQRELMARMVRGWNVETVREIIAETLDELVGPYVYAEAKRLVDGHRALGHDVIVVSASGREMVIPIANAIGATHAIATRLEIVDGHFTGEFEFFCRGENKVHAMREIARHNGYDLSSSYAYSDSISDLPMLDAVGHPVAVNPDRQLRAEATRREWPIQRFSHPVPLRERVPEKALWGAGTVAGIGIAATITGIFLGRRRRG